MCPFTRIYIQYVSVCLCYQGLLQSLSGLDSVVCVSGSEVLKLKLL